MPPATLWLDSSGRLIVDADGKPLLCEECPCPCASCPDVVHLSARGRWTMEGQTTEIQEWEADLARTPGTCEYVGVRTRYYWYYNKGGELCYTSDAEYFSTRIYYDLETKMWTHDPVGDIYPGATLFGDCPVGTWTAVPVTRDWWGTCDWPYQSTTATWDSFVIS